MKNSAKIFYWTPRIICIIAILFISLFALDAFSPELSFWQQISGFLMHLIPSFILLAILILAWKKEFIGGILFMIIGLGLSPIVFSHNYRMNHSIFYESWYYSNNYNSFCYSLRPFHYKSF